ncbi:MAG: chromosome partitioning protein [Candidatus Scalindua rubra]|uniref:Chromosome partitioning protein n=1 Tax=Candidatus Scalindua rubra TaxID=1872076 RepID=A0A1E3XEA6_9BACT|nr:MAG: chromosome partitioning protein [Candidatus Scalindua rubra]
MQVSLNDIDLSSEKHDRFLFSYGRDLNVTMDSIRKVGLINPVILKKSRGSDEAYTIVCGYQRIRACQKLGLKSIEAKIIEGLNDEEILLLILHDNLSSRGFNEIEKAIVIKKFLELGYSYDRLMSEITPLLEIPPNKNVLDKYLALLRLDSEIKDPVVRNELELEKAFLLMPLDDVERDVVCSVLFRESGTNVNEAKETIRNLLDLKQIKQKGITELLSSREISDILSDNKSNKRQKGERVYKLIKSMRSPTISKKEDEFDKSCKELGLDNDVRINHSRYFEGDEIRITIKASNEEKLRVNIEKLLSNIKNGTFKKIFSIFK